MSKISYKNLQMRVGNTFRYDWLEDVELDLSKMYKYLLGIYQLGAFVDLKNIFKNLPIVSYCSIKNADNLNLQTRDLHFETKSLLLLEDSINIVKNLSTKEIEDYCEELYDSKEYVSDVLNFIQIIKFSKFENINFTIDNIGYKITEHIIYDKTVEHDFISRLFKIFDEDMSIKNFNFFEKDIKDFIIFFDKEYENQEIDFLISEEQKNLDKVFYGEKLGQRLFEIKKYAIEHENFIKHEDIYKYFNTKKLEPIFYITSSIIKYLSVLNLIQEDEVFDEYILKYYDLFTHFLSSHGFFIESSSITEYLNLRPGDIKLTLLCPIIQRLKNRPFNVQLKLKDMIAIYYTRGLGNFDLSDELIVEIFLSHPKTFVEILKQNPFYIDIIIQNFELIKNNENTLNILNNGIKEIRKEFEKNIKEDWDNINKKEAILLLNKLKLENKNLILDKIDENILLNIYNTYQYIKDNKIKNKTTKDFNRFLLKENNRVKATYQVENWKEESLDDSFKIFSLLIKANKIEDQIKENLFNFEFSDLIGNIKAEAECKIKEFKSSFFNKISYNFEKNYSIAYEKICSKSQQLCININNNNFTDNYNQILSKYKTKEIQDNLATAEYMFSLLKEQKMELTPIFVCFLKAVEQFLCAFVNHIIVNKKAKTDMIKTDTGIVKFSKVNWEKMKVSAKNLEDFIVENYFDHNNHLDSNLKTLFLSKMHEWRFNARNGNLHKDNVYDMYKMQEYIECCYVIISVLVLLII